MTKQMSMVQAKAHFSTLVAEVAHGGEQIIIERRGRPLAALVSIADLERLKQGQILSAEPLGALALVGAWQELEDQEIDDMVADMYAQRERDIVRPVELPEE